MPISSRSAERLGSAFTYLVAAGLSIFGGIALINNSLETKFYKDYLLKWQVSTQAFFEKGGRWPSFTGNNHGEYMDQLVEEMQKHGIEPPRSNTARPYAYRLDRIGQEKEEIFVLCLPERMVVFGMSEKTFERIDRYVDGVADLDKGRFRGRSGKKSSTIIASWE